MAVCLSFLQQLRRLFPQLSVDYRLSIFRFVPDFTEILPLVGGRFAVMLITTV
jgi:hypothetical protein